MQHQSLHKRFTIKGEQISYSESHWCVQAKMNFLAIAIENDSNYKRPKNVHDGA
jgi:hypothetical protein